MTNQELHKLKPGSLLISHSKTTYPTCDKNPWSFAFLRKNGKRILVPDNSYVLFLKVSGTNGAAVLYDNQVINMWANNLEIAKQ